MEDGAVRAGAGIATNRLGEGSVLRVVGAILTGIHPPGDSHYALLHAFAGGTVLRDMTAAIKAQGYCDHEFGDSVFVERQGTPRRRQAACAASDSGGVEP